MPGKRKAANNNPPRRRKSARVADDSEAEVVPVSLTANEGDSSAGMDRRIIDFEALLRELGTLCNPKSVPKSSPLTHFPLDVAERQIHLGSDEVSVHVPTAIAKKICLNNYINLALLLKGNIELTEHFACK